MYFYFILNFFTKGSRQVSIASKIIVIHTSVA